MSAVFNVGDRVRVEGNLDDHDWEIIAIDAGQAWLRHDVRGVTRKAGPRDIPMRTSRPLADLRLIQRPTVIVPQDVYVNSHGTVVSTNFTPKSANARVLGRTARRLEGYGHDRLIPVLFDLDNQPLSIHPGSWPPE